MKDLGGQVAASLATEKSTKITSWQCLPHTPEFRYPYPAHDPVQVSAISVGWIELPDAEFHPSRVMQGVMANSTECDQILFRIISGPATEFFVMDFEVGVGAANLASPAVAIQHLMT
jgi:hypothetical protein